MAEHKQKILIFINTLAMGGAERVVWLLLKHLKNDFDIHFALYSSVTDFPIPEGVSVIRLNQPLYESGWKRLLKLPLMARKLSKYCKQQNINTVFAFLYRPCYIAAFMRQWFGYKGKIIMSERTHQTTMQLSQSSLYRWFSQQMVHYAYQKADLIIANSYAIQTDLVEKFNVTKPIKVIYNPIDLEYLRKHENDEPPITFDKNYFHFVNVGGFRPGKNHMLLIDAFFIIRDLPVKLVLVGGGEYETELRQKVSDLNLSDKVIFAGFDRQPFKYVKQSDCFVLPSDVEGFPNVLIEALAMGKACISTDCSSGPRELLAPNTDLHHRANVHFEIGDYGILSPIQDTACLAMAMKKMFADANLRQHFESKAKERADEFDVHFVKKLFQLAITTV